MNKTLVVLAVLCMATAAMAAVTMDFTATKDAGIDGGYGEHTNRGGGDQIRFCKGMVSGGEFGLFDFDTVAIGNFINSNLGGISLQDAINQGRITVNFSLVAAGLIDPAREVGVMAVYTSDNWIEGDGATGTGDDSPYNWTNAATGAQACTLDSPDDYLGQIMSPTGGGAWHGYIDNGGVPALAVGQQLKNLIGIYNGNTMTGWAQDQRTSVQLDATLWCAYILGVSSDDVTVASLPSKALKTYGFNWDGVEANMSCYTKEHTAADFAPKMTVTLNVGPTVITPHAGDAQNDGAVDVVDLGILAKNYGQTGLSPIKYTSPPDASGSWNKGDFSGDGAVDVVDLGILAKNYGWMGAPAASVPEPMTLSLLGLGAAALIRRRR